VEEPGAEKTSSPVPKQEHQCVLKAHIWESSVRNIFKILECHERDDTTQKSIGKAKLTSAEGYTPESLGSKHTGQEVHRSFI
jgi:hypothetical protein